MVITIEYCETCNYRPIAASLALAIKDKCDIETRLVSSGGQVFEVRLDDILLFSKKQSNRFPEHSEIIGMIRNLLNSC
jgi:selenoprotein W-related protein